MKVSFALNKSKTAAAPAPAPKPVVFNANDDEEDAGLSELLAKNKGGPVRNLQASTSSATKRRMDAEKQVDETVFEYDEIYDKMQEAKMRAQAAKEADSSVKKPKYMSNLLAAAATRKLDHLRAEEKMMQREREAEGDEFKDKEVFVTQAYKDQMEEVRKAEEEERRREERRKKQGGVATGMTHFYRKMLEESEQQHEAAVNASQKRVIGPQRPEDGNLTITKPLNYSKMTDVELAAKAWEEGKEVELNDDGEIVDKRELLSAGLNLSLPNTRRLGLQTSDKNKSTESAPVAHQAVGTAASRKEINERRVREIQRQMEEEKERLEREKRAAEEQSIQRTVAKRNNDSDIDSARARYLARKRQKMEEKSSEMDES